MNSTQILEVTLPLFLRGPLNPSLERPRVQTPRSGIAPAICRDSGHSDAARRRAKGAPSPARHRTPAAVYSLVLSKGICLQRAAGQAQ